MPTELHWPRRSTFVESSSDGDDDEERRYVGPGTFDVPDGMVERYLERGWERPGDDPEPEADTEASEDTDQAESDAEPEADTEASDTFDAEAFIDGSWQSVVAKIEDGEADGYLEAVEAAEEARDSTRSSVMEAISDRGR